MPVSGDPKARLRPQHCNSVPSDQRDGRSVDATGADHLFGSATLQQRPVRPIGDCAQHRRTAAKGVETGIGQRKKNSPPWNCSKRQRQAGCISKWRTQVASTVKPQRKAANDRLLRTHAVRPDSDIGRVEALKVAVVHRVPCWPQGKAWTSLRQARWNHRAKGKCPTDVVVQVHRNFARREHRILHRVKEARSSPGACRQSHFTDTCFVNHKNGQSKCQHRFAPHHKPPRARALLWCRLTRPMETTHTRAP